MTKIERPMADRVLAILCRSNNNTDAATKIAKFIHGEVAKARGKRLGYTMLDAKFPLPIRAHHDQVLFDVSDKPWPDDNAEIRIVRFMPKRKGAR